MTGIDKLFGIDKIRAEQNISGDDPFALFNELAFGTGGGETIGTGESELERATKATEGVTATDFSEQQKEIDDKIEEGNKISEEMKDNDKERNAILTETNKILANMDAKIAEVGVIAPSTEL